MGIGTETINGIASTYTGLMTNLPEQYAQILNVFIFAILICLYGIFTFKFYRHLSKKDLIELNLYKYNHLSHPLMKKLGAIFLYLIEYLIILPFLIFFWYAILSLLILVLSEELLLGQVIIVAAAMVAAIRMAAYYKEDLSKDLAKMFPFTILAIFILSPRFFSLERILTNLTDIPTLSISIIYYLIFIVALELILRIIDIIKNLLRSEEGERDIRRIFYDIPQEGKA